MRRPPWYRRPPPYSKHSGRKAQEVSDTDPLEKDIQRHVWQFYERLGARVIWMSQPKKTLQTKGIPDLYVQLPRFGGMRWWHETKRPDTHQSKAQKEFQTSEEAAAGAVVVGGLREAMQFARSKGLIA